MPFTLTGTNLDAPDATVLADLYRRLLGWTIEVDEPGWVVLRPPDGGHTLNFQTETRVPQMNLTLGAQNASLSWGNGIAHDETPCI
jgi:hypothetical protein